MDAVSYAQPDSDGTHQVEPGKTRNHNALENTVNEQVPGKPEPLMTIEDVAAYMRTPKKTLYTWRSAGRGPRAMKFGGALKYRLADVDAWLAEQYEAEVA